MASLIHSFLLAGLLLQAASPPPPGGVVMGRVLRIDGTPAVGAKVLAIVAPSVPPGLEFDDLVIAGMAQTDDAGRYHLDRVPAGRYYIRAGLLDLGAYYPGTVAVADASVVSVTGGSTTVDIDFRIKRGTGGRVKGRLAKPPTLKPAGELFLERTNASSGNYEYTRLRDDGTFEFRSVRPGIFTLRMFIGTVAAMQVVVDDEDVELELAGDPGGRRIVGKMIRTGADPDAWLPPTRVFLGTVPVPGTPVLPKYASYSNTDGTFEFLDIPPGTYQIYSEANPTVQSVITIDRDVTGIELPLQAQMQVLGRVVVEEGVAAEAWDVRLFDVDAPGMVKAMGGYLKATVGPDGSFSARVPHGRFRVELANLPAAYTVRSITSGPVDLTNSLLAVEATRAVGEIRITVGQRQQR